MVSLKFDLEALVLRLFPFLGFREYRVWALLARSGTCGSSATL